MKETSTNSRLWRMECKDFIELKQPFKVYNVSRPDDEAFCKVLLTRHNLKMQREGTMVIFSPSASRNL
jgi:hypothetical protein